MGLFAVLFIGGFIMVFVGGLEDLLFLVFIGLFVLLGSVLAVVDVVEEEYKRKIPTLEQQLQEYEIQQAEIRLQALKEKK